MPRKAQRCLVVAFAATTAAMVAFPTSTDAQATRAEARTNSIFLSATASDPNAVNPSVTIRFDRNHWTFGNGAATVYRVDTLNGTSNWGSPIATVPYTSAQAPYSFVDTNVEVGKRYLYRVDVPLESGSRTQYVAGGIATPLVEDRGVMLLVVDGTIAPQITPELDRFKKDLIGDGWQVQTISVSPSETPQQVKAKIAAAYSADPTRVTSATLLGKVPVAFSGSVSPDGHDRRPFPTDSYYADLNGNWTDSQNRTNNSPGDGKFDQDRVPSSLELQIGRISFNNMPAFSESEVELTKRYLDKNHAYRHGEFEFTNGIFLGPDMRGKDGFGASGPIFGTDYYPYVLTSTDSDKDSRYWNAQTNDAYWITTWNRGGGAYTSTWGIGHVNDLASAETINTAIHSAFASYYGEWHVNNNFLRALLAAKGHTVNVFYAYTPDWDLYPLGYGETMGYVAKISIEMEGIHLNETAFNYRDSIIPDLLGDPSIRLFPIKPPTDVAARAIGNAIEVSWEASEDTDILGYFVYRAADLDGRFERITDELLLDTQFIDTDPLDDNIYMVRAIKLQETGSGTYFDASQGIFTEFVLIPEPATAALFLLALPLWRRRQR